MTAPPAHAEPVGASPRIAAYGSGAAAVVEGVRSGETQAVGLKVAAAAQAVNSLGLGGPLVDELDVAVYPRLPASTAYGRGTGLEGGISTARPGIPDPNQVLPAGVAEASAPPASPLSVAELGPVNLGPLASAHLLRGRAQAWYDPGTCAVGQPLALGEGEAGALQLLGVPNPLTGDLLLPLVGLSVPPAAPDRSTPNVTSTRSVSYLAPNGDGSSGIVSETRQTVAPVSLLGGLVTVELLGEWVLRATATGKPGGARIDYGPVGATSSTPVVKVNDTAVTLQQLLGPNGFVLDLAPVATVSIGGPPHAAFAGSPGVASSDGTIASAAVDVLRVTVLDAPTLGLHGADVRVGHMEAGAVAPSGGYRCEAAVSETVDPGSLGAGDDVPITAVAPPDADTFHTAAVARADAPTLAATGGSGGRAGLGVVLLVGGLLLAYVRRRGPATA